MEIYEELKGRIRTKEDLLRHSPILLWGVGFAFEDCVESVGRDRIAAVFDNDPDKWGKVVSGYEVLSPEDKWERYFCDTAAVVISTNGYEYEIAKDLTGRRGVRESQLFSNTNSVVEAHRYKPEAVQAHWERILEVREQLADRESKEYYMNFITACLTRNPLYFKDNPKSTAGYEYETDLAQVGLRGGEVILDCGAYNGDTARLFMEKTHDDCEVYCFEPVDENYRELEDWIRREGLTRIHAVHSGVGGKRRIDKVYSTEEKTTKASVGSNRFQSETPFVSEILVDTLDHMAAGVAVDYIKMDIEGAEMDALRGAAGIIRARQPQMLISAYHKIEDMWEVPEFVLGICPEYHVFLGHQPHAPYEPEFLFAK